MDRRPAVLALTAAVASAVAYALMRMRRGAGFPWQRRRSQTERYTCECGQELRMAGAGRHRVFWLVDAPESDPVLGDECPRCSRALPRTDEARAAVPASPGDTAVAT